MNNNTILNPKISQTHTKNLQQTTCNSFAYVKTTGENPQYMLVNSVLMAEWFGESNPIINLSDEFEFEFETYHDWPIICYLPENLLTGFSILYCQLITANIPSFDCVDDEISYIMVVNRMVIKEKIDVLLDGILFSIKFYQQLVTTDLNAKDFLSEYSRLEACDAALHETPADQTEFARNVFAFYDIKYIRFVSDNYIAHNKYYFYGTSSNDLYKLDSTQHRVLDKELHLVYQLTRIAPEKMNGSTTIVYIALYNPQPFDEESDIINHIQQDIDINVADSIKSMKLIKSEPRKFAHYARKNIPDIFGHVAIQK